MPRGNPRGRQIADTARLMLASLRYIARALKCRYRDHRVELETLLGALRPGDVAVDVGANKGAFLWSLARRVGPTGRVMAIEPQPALATYLRTMAQRFRWRHVDVLEMAASDASRRVPMHVPKAGTSPGATLVGGEHVPSDWTSVEVRCESLDELLTAESRRVAAIKIDVEGYEAQVFAGAEKSIARHCPVLVFECEERHLVDSNAASGVRDVIDWLTARNYGVSFALHGKLIDASEYRSEIHQRREGDRYWDSPDYANNFVAVPLKR
jgi:FkbM family methyltransferase